MPLASTGYRATWIFFFALLSLLACQWLPLPWQEEKRPEALPLFLCLPDYQLHTQQLQKLPTPLICEVGDDPHQIFDQNPPSASDNAVLLASLHELGVQQLSLMHPLTWEQPDPFAVAALEHQAQRFQRTIIACAVTRGSQEDPLPAAFQRASLPLSQIKGKVALLPRVNRLALAHSYTGREQTWAGFSDIESSPSENGRAPLLAVWQDRVIFSAALLNWLCSEQATIDDLDVTPGQCIFLRKKQLRLPIDDFGTISVSNSTQPTSTCAITDLIRPEAPLKQTFQTHASGTWICPRFHDDPVSQQQLQTYLQLRSLSENRRYLEWYPLPAVVEVLLLAIIAWLLAWLSEQSTRLHIGGVVLLSLLLAGWILFLPQRPLLLPLLAAAGAQTLFPLLGIQRLIDKKMKPDTTNKEATHTHHEPETDRSMPSD